MRENRQGIPRIQRPAGQSLAFAAGLLVTMGMAHELQAAVRFSPFPVAAGQPFTVIVEDIPSPDCGGEGELTAQVVAGSNPPLLLLTFQAPNVICFSAGLLSPYYGTTVVPGISAGTYAVLLNEIDPSGLPRRHVRTGLTVVAAPACANTETALCLHDGRFEVKANWTDFEQRNGQAHASPFDSHALLKGDPGNWGTFWFFSPDNPELLVKIIDGCALNNHYWVFLTPASTVFYQITVRDMATGAVRQYSNPLGLTPGLIADTSAFPCS